jgi:polyketide synthase Type III
MIPTDDSKSLRTLAQISAVGIGLPPHKYTQDELLDTFSIKDRRIRSLFLNSAIKQRYLTLPSLGLDGRHVETQGELLRKHTNVGLAMGRDSILRCLDQIKATRSEIRHICCVSSTGFIVPGFSALLIKDLGLREDCSRLDVVGMGCNAGLNALSAVAAWANTHPEQLALMVCIETCSAAYVFDNTMRTSVVNSLFGDGAAAISVIASPQKETRSPIHPSLLRFSSYIIPDQIDAMRYDWDDLQGKFSFFLSPEIPYVIGAYAERALQQLLKGTDLCSYDIKHWLVHSGGKKVIDSVRVNLGLTQYDVRHTIGVLRDHGNVSSGSFLFSYDRLLQEGIAVAGEYGVMMTMGPGSTIEMALLQWRH